MAIRIRSYLCVIVAVLVASVNMSGVAWAASHPLDPLSADEIRATTEVIKRDARLANAGLPFITLADPAKAEVIAWQPGRPIARHARAVAVTDTGVFEVLVGRTGDDDALDRSVRQDRGIVADLRSGLVGQPGCGFGPRIGDRHEFEGRVLRRVAGVQGAHPTCAELCDADHLASMQAA